MAGYYSVSDVLAYMDISMPEDDDSDDDFEGYIDEEEIGDDRDGGDYNGDLSGESDEGSSDDGIPQYTLNSGCTQDMTCWKQLSSRPSCSPSNTSTAMSCHAAHGCSSGLSLLMMWWS